MCREVRCVRIYQSADYLVTMDRPTFDETIILERWDGKESLQEGGVVERVAATP